MKPVFSYLLVFTLFTAPSTDVFGSSQSDLDDQLPSKKPRLHAPQPQSDYEDDDAYSSEFSSGSQDAGSDSRYDDKISAGTLQVLPTELNKAILEFLDWRSLCRMDRTSMYFRGIVYTIFDERPICTVDFTFRYLGPYAANDPEPTRPVPINAIGITDLNRDPMIPGGEQTDCPIHFFVYPYYQDPTDLGDWVRSGVVRGEELKLSDNYNPKAEPGKLKIFREQSPMKLTCTIWSYYMGSREPIIDPLTRLKALPATKGLMSFLDKIPEEAKRETTAKSLLGSFEAENHLVREQITQLDDQTSVRGFLEDLKERMTAEGELGRFDIPPTALFDGQRNAPLGVINLSDLYKDGALLRKITLTFKRDITPPGATSDYKSIEFSYK